MQLYDKVLKFWFGRVEETIVPSENRARIWFGEDPRMDNLIRDEFGSDLENAVAGQYEDWKADARGQLALILLYDQFSRHIYRNTPAAFAQDAKALEICRTGIHNESDHSLSLIERVFYYFPLLHSEQLTDQEKSLRAYQILAELAFSETKVIYDSFLKFSNHHYGIVQRFGRFPQRNKILGRISTQEELAYLRDMELS